MSNTERLSATRTSASTTMSSKRDALLITVVAVSAILPFALAPLRAQILGPAGRGEFAFFQSSVTTAGIFAALGLRFACYELGFLREKRFRFGARRLAVYSVAGALLVLVPATWIAFVKLGPLVGFAIATTILLAPGSALVQIETANANFLQKRIRIAAISSLPALFEFFCTLALAMARWFTLSAAIVTTLLAESLRSITAVFWHYRDRRKVRIELREADRQLEGRLVAASIKAAPAVVIPLLSGNLDILLFALSTEASVLGNYAVAKLGFSALFISGSILEGRFMAAFRRFSKGRALLGVGVCAVVLAFFCGISGWFLTPIIFGKEFIASSVAFPALAAAGALALIFGCISAAAAQERKSSIVPGLAVLTALLAGCFFVPLLVGTDAVSLTWALIGAQFTGVVVVLVQFFRPNGNNDKSNTFASNQNG